MITIPQATEKIIKRSRYLSEALAKGLINASSLARYIQPEVEQIVFKPVTHSAIMMAIKRMPVAKTVSSPFSLLFQEAPDMIVRSNLTLYKVKTSPTLLRKLLSIENQSQTYQKRVLFTYARAEASILVNSLLAEDVARILAKEITSLTHQESASITIHLPETAENTPGVIYFFLKSLAWEGINLLEVFLTQQELTLVFSQSESITAFSLLQSLFIPQPGK